MDVSAVVLSFNSLRYIKTCVESLMNSYAECGVQGDVFVVDNGSVDGSVQALKSLQDRFGDALHVEYLPHNTGTTRSRNLALRQCTGQSVLILDSDAYMNAPALKELLAYQAQHPEAGLVAPKLTYPDGRFQLSVDVFPTIASLAGDAHMRRPGWLRRPGRARPARRSRPGKRPWGCVLRRR